MQLSESMRAELQRRLTIKQREMTTDPAFQPMPALDWIALAAVFGLSLAALALI